MQHRRTITMAALAVAAAGLTPALVSAADRSPGTTPGGDYCATHLALEAAVGNDDPGDDQAAFEAAQAAAPEEIADALAATLANAPTDGPPSPEFYESYGAVIDWLRDNCGFGEIEVLAQDYSFGGIGGEVAAGPTIIDLVNEGEEYHEIILMRRTDEATMPVEELLALPEEELGAMVTFAGAAFAAPGATGSTVVDLAPGDYVALCFIPVGSTEEAMAEMMAAEASTPPDSAAGPGTAPVDTASEASMPSEGSMVDDTAAAGSMVPGDSMAPGAMGPPHFTEGMYVEFTVVEGEPSDGSDATVDPTATSEASEGSDATATTATPDTAVAETTGDSSVTETTTG